MRSRRFAAVMALLAIVVGASACMGDRHYQVGRDEFCAKLATINTLYSSHLIGSDQDRAYLARWQMGILFGPSNDIYSVALVELNAEERAALLAGQNPWQQDPGHQNPGQGPSTEPVTGKPPGR